MSQRVSVHLEKRLIAALDEAARHESVDRGAMIRKLLTRGISRHKLDRAIERYQLGEISLGRAVQDAGVTHYDILDELHRRDIEYPLTPEGATEHLLLLRRIKR